MLLQTKILSRAELNLPTFDFRGKSEDKFFNTNM